MARASSKTSNLEGREKAAMLLIALGPERSAEVFKHLKEEEIENSSIYYKRGF